VPSVPPRFFAVAHLLRPRGNKGELAAELLTDFPARLTKLQQVYLSDGKNSAAPRLVNLKTCWLSQNHRGQAVFHFEGVNSIDDAEKLRGMDVMLPIEQRVTLPAGQYFVSDLVGCSVFELPGAAPALSPPTRAPGEAPALLGTVVGVEFPGEDFPGTPLLAVDSKEGELLVPLAEDICRRIDVSARRIDVLLPEGLRELDRDE
jgi:16S rRNA processing protein RimM